MYAEISEETGHLDQIQKSRSNRITKGSKINLGYRESIDNDTLPPLWNA